MEAQHLAMNLNDGIIDDAVSLLRDVIRIDTTNPGRPEAPAATVLERFLDERGVPANLLEPQPGRTSVVARISGTEPRAPSLLLLSHLDVVPAGDPDIWDHGPFSGDVDSGFVYGRGAIDDKGRAAVNAAVLVALRRDPPPGDVLFVAAADEETGGELGVKWLREHHPNTLAATFALGEGGGYRGEFGGRAFYAYATAEKGAFGIQLTFRAQDPGGHASVPGAENVAEAAAKAAVELTNMRWPWTRTQATVSTLRSFSAGGPLLGRVGPWALGLPVLGPLLLRRGIGMSEPQQQALHAMFHIITTLTSLESGRAHAGAMPNHAEVHFSVRYLPGTSPDDLAAAIGKRLARLGLDPEISIEHGVRPRTASPTSPLATAIRQTMAELDPTADLIPILLPASTDLRDLDPETVSYGFTPMRGITADEVPLLAHGPNERIAVADVGFGIEAVVRIAHRLGSGPNA